MPLNVIFIPDVLHYTNKGYYYYKSALLCRRNQKSVCKPALLCRRNRKSVCLVDLTGQNRTLPGLGRRTLDLYEDEIDPSQAWKVGFSETSGIRNK